MKKMVLLLMIYATAQGMNQDEKIKHSALLEFKTARDSDRMRRDPALRSLLELGCKYSFIHSRTFGIGPFHAPADNHLIPLFAVRKGCTKLIEHMEGITTSENFPAQFKSIHELIEQQYQTAVTRSAASPKEFENSFFTSPGARRDFILQVRTDRLLAGLCKNFEYLASEESAMWGILIKPNTQDQQGDEYFVDVLDEMTLPAEYLDLKQKFKETSKKYGLSKVVIDIDLDEKIQDSKDANKQKSVGHARW